MHHTETESVVDSDNNSKGERKYQYFPSQEKILFFKDKIIWACLKAKEKESEKGVG